MWKMSSLTALTVCLWLWWRGRKNRKIKLTYDESSSRAAKFARWVFFANAYFPPFWCVSGIFQTILTAFMRRPLDLRFVRETIVLPEKTSETQCAPEIIPRGVVSLDWAFCRSMHPAVTDNDDDDGDDDAAEIVVIVIPGLTGSSDAGYVQRLAHHIISYSSVRVRVACYNPRGRGGNPLVSPFLYSAGYTEDLRRVVEHVHRKCGANRRIVAVGYSLGSNVLAKMCGEDGNDSLLAGACCLACPIDPLGMSNHLKNTIEGKLMDRVLLRFVAKVAKESASALQSCPLVDMDAIGRSTSMSKFDRFAVAPLMNCKCSSDYYRRASSGLYLSAIRRPVLFLHAENDPIVSARKIRVDNFKCNPHLISCMTREGGHSMDWPTGTLARRSWSAGVVTRFVEALAGLGAEEEEEEEEEKKE